MTLPCSLLPLILGCSVLQTAVVAAAPTSTNPPTAEPAPTGPGIYNVKLPPYNAKGDGVTDDTLAIRSAIGAACNAGGGEIYLPNGVFVVSPQDQSELGALIIPCDNITLAGAGLGVSVLSRKTIGDSDPDKMCPQYDGQVNARQASS